jgi:hypothetical protein
MNDIEFTAVCAQMRYAQQKYFALPMGHPEKGKYLDKAKRLEGIIDREIKRRINTMGKDKLREAFKPYDDTNVKQLTLL